MILLSKKIVPLPVLLLLVAGGLAAAEDLTIISKVTARGQSSTSTTYLTADKFRSANGESESIVDLKNGQMTLIDNRKKEYWQTSAEEMKAMMAQVEEQMKAMGSNPLMERVMGGGGAAPVSVTKGGASRTVAGYKCDSYLISMGEMRMDVCATPDLQIPLQYFDARNAFFAGNPMTSRFTKITEEMRKIKGFPVAETMTWKMMGQDLGWSREATEVKKGPIPASAFDVPAGYKKVENPMAKMAGRKR